MHKHVRMLNMLYHVCTYRVYREIGLFWLMWVLSWGREIGLFFRVYPELGLFRKALCLCMNLQKRVACGSAFFPALPRDLGWRNRPLGGPIRETRARKSQKAIKNGAVRHRWSNSFMRHSSFFDQNMKMAYLGDTRFSLLFDVSHPRRSPGASPEALGRPCTAAAAAVTPRSAGPSQPRRPRAARGTQQKSYVSSSLSGTMIGSPPPSS